MYNLLEYSSNYSNATNNLWFYSKLKQLILMLILGIMIISNISSHSITLSAKYHQKLSKLPSKAFEISAHWNE